jgi:hypothetical protein
MCKKVGKYAAVTHTRTAWPERDEIIFSLDKSLNANIDVKNGLY